MIHSSNYEARVAPVYNGGASAEIDRAQELRLSTTLNRTEVKELGNPDSVCWKKGIPTTNVTLRQNEYGAIELFQKLANSSDTNLTWAEFKTSAVDISAYLTDDDDVFKGTVWAKGLRMSGFGVSIGDPDALLERNFTLVGEDYSIYQNDNKYIVYLQFTATGDTSQSFTIGSGDYAAYTVPVNNPDDSGTYFLRVIRYRASDSTNTEMVEGTDFTYTSGTGEVAIDDDSVSTSDVFTFVYSTGTYVSGQVPFTANTSDLCSVKADEVTIYLETSTTVSRLQSVSFDVAYDRTDIKEIGTTDVVARGARTITTTVNLGTFIESWSLDEVLRDKVGLSYGVLDVRNYTDDITLKVLIYSDNTKSTFKMGYKITGLTPTSAEDSETVDEYLSRNGVLESTNTDSCFVSTTEGDFS